MTEERRLRAALTRIAGKARGEANDGAPAGMVATYIEIEVLHTLAAHDGDAQDCSVCSQENYMQRRLAGG